MPLGSPRAWLLLAAWSETCTVVPWHAVKATWRWSERPLGLMCDALENRRSRSTWVLVPMQTGSTALFEAAAEYNTNAIRVLLDHGADPDWENDVSAMTCMPERIDLDLKHMVLPVARTHLMLATWSSSMVSARDVDVRSWARLHQSFADTNKTSS